MMRHSYHRDTQAGIVLVSSLLLLLVVTILALTMFRSFGIQEKIAGNTKEKQRALQAAETAQQYAERWLANGGATTSTPANCTAPSDANLGNFQICTNTLVNILGTGNIAKMPWRVNGIDVGTTYVPPNMVIGQASVTAPDNYAKKPGFYIADLGLSIDPLIPGEIYQIDAVGYGGDSATAAVVESTFAVYVSSRNATL